MSRNVGTAVKEKYRQDFTVPSASGSYAFERLTFGAVPADLPEDSFIGVTCVVESSVATSVVELWLPRISGGTKHPSTFIDSDYVYSGESIASSGGETWALAGYPGAQIRVKSGGTGGTATISATAF